MKKDRSRGITLIELLVGLAIGLLIILAVTLVYLSVLRSSAETLAAARLNHDVRAAMTTITGDLRRVGYWNYQGADAPSVPPDDRSWWPADYPPPRYMDITADGGCIRYAYDRSGNGTIEGNEHFGFRLSSSQLQLWVGTGPADCDNDGNWEILIGDSTVFVTDLLFSEDEEDGTELPNNYLRVFIGAQRVSQREGVVAMELSDTVYLRNAEPPEEVN